MSLYGPFIKEFKSIYRQISKSNKFIQFVVGIIVIFLIYHFIDISWMIFSWKRLSSIHYGREGLVTGQPKTLVYFYMNGCPYCQKFDGGWDDFVGKNKTSIVTKKVESKEALAQKMKVGGYPSVLLLQGDRKINEWKDRKVPQSPSEQESINNQNSASLLAFCQSNQ